MLGNLEPQLRWYQKRFTLAHPWGMVGWQTQGWAAMYDLTHAQSQADFVFAVADWALNWQHEKSVAFLTDLDNTGPSFHTAFISEGIADAWALAKRLGNRERARRYENSWQQATRFMNQLIIRPEDTFCVHDPQRAMGGVRGSLFTTAVRIDYVSHSLIALVKGAQSLDV